jgi:hypothetical protein
MSMIATTISQAPRYDAAASKAGNPRHDDIVEINLLLPSEWACDLMELSRERGQSVGQILRSMIGQALHDATPGY